MGVRRTTMPWWRFDAPGKPDAGDAKWITGVALPVDAGFTNKL